MAADLSHRSARITCAIAMTAGIHFRAYGICASIGAPCGRGRRNPGNRRVSGAELSAAAPNLPRGSDPHHVGRLDKSEGTEGGTHRIGDVAGCQVAIMLFDHARVGMP